MFAQQMYKRSANVAAATTKAEEAAQRSPTGNSALRVSDKASSLEWKSPSFKTPRHSL